jgi:gamma-glutamylcyclotransferase (GGCT)/AIG2-like uncharacterized protein YtfP
MMLYFAYGSNMWREQMIKRCPDHRYIGNGIFQGYRWIISERGYAYIIKSESDEVHGVVYEISDTDEKRLDRYEGVGTLTELRAILFALQRRYHDAYGDPDPAFVQALLDAIKCKVVSGLLE